MFPLCSQFVPKPFRSIKPSIHSAFKAFMLFKKAVFPRSQEKQCPTLIAGKGRTTPSHAVGTKKPPRWAASGAGSGEHSANALPKGNHFGTLAQLVEVVRPLLHLIEALGQVLGAVVAAPIGILHGMGQVRLNGQRI